MKLRWQSLLLSGIKQRMWIISTLSTSCTVLNAILASSYVPKAFKVGLVILVPKGRNKDLSNPSNYRSITILSNLSKGFERLILTELRAQDSPPSLNPLQGGFRPGYSCSHCAFIYEEAVQSVREKGCKVYVAFLDVRKAFDTVWHLGLLVKIFQKGITGSIWKVIDNWYASSSSVLWNSSVSKPFTIAQGVRQGGILSPLHYCLFVDELLDMLTAAQSGISISGIYCSAPMYADNLTLLADSPDDLQKMLDISQEYADKWRYSFNTDKSAIKVFGETAKSRATLRLKRKWKLGDLPLAEVDEEHHLGILRSVHNSTVHRTNERCSSARSDFYALNTIGSCFGSLHPITSFRLYQSLCLPTVWM